MPLTYDFEIITFVKKYDLPPRLIPQVVRYKELMIKDTPTPSEVEEITNLATVLEPYNITANDYNKLFQAVQNMQNFIKVDLVTYLNVLFAGYDTRMQTIETTFSNRLGEMNTEFNAEIQQMNTQQSTFQGWFDGAKNNITTLQSFYFQNWSELNGCKYKEHPKNAEGKYITTINATADDKLIARQTEWQEVIAGVTCYMLKQEVFDTDGITVVKEKTKKEYKDAATGIYISEVI